MRSYLLFQSYQTQRRGDAHANSVLPIEMRIFSLLLFLSSPTQFDAGVQYAFNFISLCAHKNLMILLMCQHRGFPSFLEYLLSIRSVVVYTRLQYSACVRTSRSFLYSSRVRLAYRSPRSIRFFNLSKLYDISCIAIEIVRIVNNCWAPYYSLVFI